MGEVIEISGIAATITKATRWVAIVGMEKTAAAAAAAAVAAAAFVSYRCDSMFLKRHLRVLNKTMLCDCRSFF